jgi:hypothetical protein
MVDEYEKAETLQEAIEALDAETVKGPAGSVTNSNLAKWDGTDGRLLKDGGSGGGGGSGDVVGPASAVDQNVAMFDGTTGKLIEDAGVAIADVSQAISDSSTLIAAVGAAGGLATLDGSSKVPIAQIPTGTTGSTVALGDAPAAAVATHLSSVPHLSHSQILTRTLGA